MEQKTQHAQHTPGPWLAQNPRGEQHAIDRKWEVVALLPGGGEQVIVGEHTGVDCLREANARLIAAAPELLAALQELVWEADLGEVDLEPEDRAKLDRARAAIAAATGQQP